MFFDFCKKKKKILKLENLINKLIKKIKNCTENALDDQSACVDKYAYNDDWLEFVCIFKQISSYSTGKIQKSN